MSSNPPVENALSLSTSPWHWNLSSSSLSSSESSNNSSTGTIDPADIKEQADRDARRSRRRPQPGTDSFDHWAPHHFLPHFRDAIERLGGKPVAQKTSGYAIHSADDPTDVCILNALKAMFNEYLQGMYLVIGCVNNAKQLESDILSSNPWLLSQAMVSAYQSTAEKVDGGKLTPGSRIGTWSMHVLYSATGVLPDMTLPATTPGSSAAQLPPFSSSISEDVIDVSDDLASLIHDLQDLSTSPSIANGDAADLLFDITSNLAPNYMRMFRRVLPPNPTVAGAGHSTGSTGNNTLTLATPVPPRHIHPVSPDIIEGPHIQLYANRQDYEEWKSRDHWNDIAEGLVERVRKGEDLGFMLGNLFEQVFNRIRPRGQFPANAPSESSRAEDESDNE